MLHREGFPVLLLREDRLVTPREFEIDHLVALLCWIAVTLLVPLAGPEGGEYGMTGVRLGGAEGKDERDRCTIGWLPSQMRYAHGRISQLSLVAATDFSRSVVRRYQ